MPFLVRSVAHSVSLQNKGAIRRMWKTDVEALRESLRQGTLDAFAGAYRLMGKIPPPRTPRVQFVYLHYVYDEQVPLLRSLVAWLRSNFSLISYTEAVERLHNDRIEDAYASLSFDDGLRQASLNAGRVLEEEGISGCFFVCPGVIGETDPGCLEHFWERINHPPAEVLRWSDVETLLEWGHEIGSHTYTHRNLGEVSATTVETELRRARETLVPFIDGPVHFAWPYGRFDHINPETAKLARDAGYDSLASAERGCHVAGVRDPGELCLRRDHVHLSWPLRHVEWFLARNAVNPAYQQNGWPQDLGP